MGKKGKNHYSTADLSYSDETYDICCISHFDKPQ